MHFLRCPCLFLAPTESATTLTPCKIISQLVNYYKIINFYLKYHTLFAINFDFIKYEPSYIAPEANF